MADIAFLLLIFFLVTTTISADKGILRQLPSDCLPNTDCVKDIEERNLLHIYLNSNQEIMINENIVKLEDIKNEVKSFVDNNGAAQCDYCKGLQSLEYSVHPNKAVISLSHDALTKYDLFVSVQDEITKAYYDLRKGYIKQQFNKSPHQVTKEELELVKKAYPFIISEVMVKRN
jgi:biopolymer transport protein ExbD